MFLTCRMTRRIVLYPAAAAPGELSQNGCHKKISSSNKRSTPSFLRHMNRILSILCMVYLLSIDTGILKVSSAAFSGSVEDLLAQADDALSYGDLDRSILLYQETLQNTDSDDNLTVQLSAYTNMATALSSKGNSHDQLEAIEAYQKALLLHQQHIDDIVDKNVKSDIDSIASQAAFFLAMEYQDTNRLQDAAEAYSYAHRLDPLHWASAANLAALLQDHFKQYDRALQSYNEAYRLLTSSDVVPTDPPEDPSAVLGQLQYRIGLCITYGGSRKCALVDDPATTVDCNEMARQAFSLSIQFDPSNEAAKHMLATVTADATMSRASNKYVKALFDDYAKNFEYSLVEELGYTGYERLRRGFDKAFHGNTPTSKLVVDAGCGTGLAGEQFRNVSDTLIGVDLSQSILDEAARARPGLYDQTIAGDVIPVFEELRPISLIIAADSYIYFGDLSPLFASMAESLNTHGYAAFTLENVSLESEKVLIETNPDWRWQLTPSGRFAHRKEYVEGLAEEFGLQSIYYEPLEDFRYEQGTGVRGHIFIIQKLPVQDEL